MTFVDTSVWIDWINGTSTPQTVILERLFPGRTLLVGDLVLVELLQGFTDDRAFERTRSWLMQLELVDVAGVDIALQAARNRRFLRATGCTPRSTIDTLIATRCIHEGWPLLASDRDFAPFAEHLGLHLMTE